MFAALSRRMYLERMSSAHRGAGTTFGPCPFFFIRRFALFVFLQLAGFLSVHYFSEFVF